MGMVIDMIGKQCGRLNVIARGPDYIEPKSGYHRAQWWCKCSCGNISLVSGKDLRNGNTKSCGCLVREHCTELGKVSKGKNKYEFHGDIVIGFTMKGERFYFDIDDYENVRKHYWYKHHSGYIHANTMNGTIALHRFVMHAGPNVKIDHINHQKENACKSNLRIVSSCENGANEVIAKNNTSGVTGVDFNKRRGLWIARLMKEGISHYLGAYDNFDDAVAARKAAEDKFYGEYSYDNSMAASPLIEAV